jgi:hydroxymethylpyrimidine pyrophosphatase-like HAD family hydrolase
MAPIKLLIADVDGTLVTKAKVLTPRAREALSTARPGASPAIGGVRRRILS